MHKKSLSHANEKGLKFGHNQPDSLGRANNNADNDNICIGIHHN